MKMTMVLLVSSVALLVGAADIRLIRNKIIDLILEIKTKKNLEGEKWFVENLKEQDSNCGNVFFCKVQEVLKHFNNTELKNLFEQSKRYNKARHVNCTEKLQGKESSKITVPIKDMMTDVVYCMRKINMHGENNKTGSH